MIDSGKLTTEARGVHQAIDFESSKPISGPENGSSPSALPTASMLVLLKGVFD
jgi:hypothetical protein